MALTQFSISMPLVQIPVYIRELGASITQVGLYFTLSMVFPLLVRVFGGWLADSVGRLRIIFFGSVTGVLTYAAYAAAPTWQAALIAPALMAVTSALTIPAYWAHLADISPEDSRGRMYGVSQTVYRAAGVIAPPIGGLLGASMGYRVMFGVSTLVFGLSALIFFALLRRRTSAPKPEQEFSLSAFRSSMGEIGALFIAGGVVTWILLVDGVRDIAFSLSYDLMPVYLSDIAGIGKEGIGLLFGLYGVASLLTLFPAGWLTDRTSERAVISAALVCVVCSRLVFAIAGSFWGFALSWMLLGVGASLFQPSGGALIARVVPSRLRGTFFGLFATTLSVFSLPAPWVGSQVWELIGPRFPFLITVVLGGLTILPAWHKLYVPKSPPKPPVPKPTPDIATVLSISYPAEAAERWLSEAERIVGQHLGVFRRSGDSSLSACFGLAPNRTPPQVSALLATHAAFSISDLLQELTSKDGRPFQQLEMGVFTGPVGRSASGGADAPANGPATLNPLEEVLRRAQALQRSSRGAGLLISEATYLYLGSAKAQFEFGGSGPLPVSIDGITPIAHQVIRRLQPLNPAVTKRK